MTETTDTAAPAADTGAKTAKKKPGGLNTMLLADLKSMAGGLGIPGAGSMKKAQLVDAIKASQSGGQSRRDDQRGTTSATSSATSATSAGRRPSDRRPRTAGQAAADKQGSQQPKQDNQQNRNKQQNKPDNKPDEQVRGQAGQQAGRADPQRPAGAAGRPGRARRG